MRDRRLRRLYLRFRERADTAALGELFDELGPELLRVARHVARDAAEAEDLVQASFLTLIEHPERYDASRPIAAWAAGVLSKHAKAWGRSAARRVEPERALATPLAREERERPEALVEAGEAAALVRAAIAQLPPRQRELAAAHLLEHKAPAELARERGAPPVTVRVQLHRALAKLRALLPAGAAGAAVLVAPERGHAALRAELLDAARASAAAAAGGGATLSSLVALRRAGLVALALLFAAGLVGGLELLAPDAPESPPAALAAAPEPRADEAAARSEARRPVSQLESGRQDEAPAAAPAPLRQSLRIRTRFADGAPAPGIQVRLVRGTRGVGDRWLRTDAEGLARVDDLEPDLYSLVADRGGHALAQLSGATMTLGPGVSKEQLEALREQLALDVELRLEPGRDLRGVVVDAAGRPVAGASVWVATGFAPEAPRELARSDAGGRFALRQLALECLLGARADGHAPSAPAHVRYLAERQPEGELALELALQGPSARVAGRVLDPAGRPVAGAHVRLGAQRFFDNVGPRGAEGPPPPIELVTDESGTFAGDGLAPGVVGLACRAEGFPLCATSVQVEPGAEARVELCLEPGARVRGLVTDADGAPLRGASVRAWQPRLSAGEGSSFHEPWTQTDAEGRYELGPLLAGAASLEAKSWDRSISARIELELAPHELREWSPRLGAEAELAGRALDERGAPLAGWTVVAQPETRPGPPPRAVATQADGRFTLRFPTAGRVRLELYAPDERPDEAQRDWVARRAPSVWLDGVEVGRRDVALALDPARAPTARLGAELASASGAPLPALFVTLVHERFDEVADLELPAGATRLELGEQQAGAHTLRLRAEGHAPLVLRELRLERGATLELGRLVLESAR